MKVDMRTFQKKVPSVRPLVYCRCADGVKQTTITMIHVYHEIEVKVNLGPWQSWVRFSEALLIFIYVFFVLRCVTHTSLTIKALPTLGITFR